MIKSILPALASGLFAITAVAQSQLDATHNELRALRDGVLDAMNKGDIDRQLSYLHTNVVVTWHNAEVSRGREGVRAYYNRLTSGPEKMVSAFRASITVDELTILHGDSTGIAFGSSTENFTLTSGRDFQLKGRWSATLVKEGGRWLIASLHASTNIFDNTLLNLAKKTAIWVGVFGLFGGVVLGWLLGRRRKVAVP